MRFAILAALAAIVAVPTAEAGPLAYAICQTGCNSLVVACYANAGAVFGTVTAGVGVAPAILACNAALGTCFTACATAALCAPTP
ncbi:hypothetical protein C8T65DRAFT_744563 [Cerioporus squamosus]|nr:hypothetical protein C8T65DRAFT_744563 [Cerioporus squamosus]